MEAGSPACWGPGFVGSRPVYAEDTEQIVDPLLVAVGELRLYATQPLVADVGVFGEVGVQGVTCLVGLNRTPFGTKRS